MQLNVDDSFVAKTALKRVQWPLDNTLQTLLSSQESPLNPRAGDYFFPYGTLPVYVTKATAALAYGVTGDPYFTGLPGVQLTGRALSGLFDLVTLLIVVALGARLWGRWWGLVAGALYAFAIIPIQISHFFITDGFMATFMAATLLFLVLLLQTGHAWFAPLAGVCVGLAMACKLSAAPALVLPVLALLLRAWDGREREAWPSQLRRIALLTAATLGGALLSLFVSDPYSLLDSQPYLAQLVDQGAIQNGTKDQWFTRKYVGTWPLLHSWGQLMLLGVGPFVGLLGTLGLGVISAQAWRKRSGVEVLLLAGAVTYFASIALWEIKWVRYLIPMSLYICLFATALFVSLSRVRRPAPGTSRAMQNSQQPAITTLVAILIGLAIGSAVLGALAVGTIYRTEHTQIEASRWLYENAPAGSAIGIETTAIEMPLALPGSPDPTAHYTLVKWDPLADRSSPEAAAALRQHLEASDYLILDTTQAKFTVPRLPWRYPVQIRYYDLLFSGKLGFSLAHRATSYPRAGSLEIPDDGGWVDPSFMDSSHPPIYVFKKERALFDTEWDSLFAEAASKPSTATRLAP